MNRRTHEFNSREFLKDSVLIQIQGTRVDFLKEQKTRFDRPRDLPIPL